MKYKSFWYKRYKN